MVARTQPLLTGLALTTVVVTATLGWTGWRLLQQQRVLDDQRVREQEASAADALAARVGGRLAEAGERLSNWVASPASPLPVIDGAVVVATGPGGPGVSPSGGLPYVPTAPDEPSESRFAAAEALEFRGDAARAMAAYRTMASERDPRARAGALVRLGRVQRKLGDLHGALTSYERLAVVGPVRTGDVPAELAALNGQLAVYRAMADHQRSSETAQRMLKGLDTGRWLITRGPAELYREAFSEPRPPSWRLAAALSEVRREWGGRERAPGLGVWEAWARRRCSATFAEYRTSLQRVIGLASFNRTGRSTSRSTGSRYCDRRGRSATCRDSCSWPSRYRQARRRPAMARKSRGLAVASPASSSMAVAPIRQSTSVPRRRPPAL